MSSFDKLYLEYLELEEDIKEQHKRLENLYSQRAEIVGKIKPICKHPVYDQNALLRVCNVCGQLC